MLHRLEASPETVHWGFYQAGLEPVLRIRSGDRVDVETFGGRADSLRPVERELLYRELPRLRSIHKEVKDRGPGGHILTGPIEVDGARAGDVLAITVNKARPIGSFGWNFSLPGMGALPDEYLEKRFKTIRFDPSHRRALFSPSIKIPLRPFFGHHGVAPPASAGRVTSLVPGRHGGNLDVKALGIGSVVYLPVQVQGALYSVGDGHAVQGDGEVCLSALESCMRGVLRFEVRHDMRLEWPMAETESHIICMGFHADLDEAARIAVGNTLSYLRGRGLGKDEAYSLSSLVVDLRISQLVNSLKGVYAMLPKSIMRRPGGRGEPDDLLAMRITT